MWHRAAGDCCRDAYGMRYNLPTILDNMIYDQRLPAMAG
jgi:hypothetical protein